MFQPTDQPITGTQMKVTVSTPGLMRPMLVGSILSLLLAITLGLTGSDLATTLIIAMAGVAVILVTSYVIMCGILIAMITDALSNKLGYAVKIDEEGTRFETSDTNTVRYGTLQRLDTGDIFAKRQTFLVTFIG